MCDLPAEIAAEIRRQREHPNGPPPHGTMARLMHDHTRHADQRVAEYQQTIGGAMRQLHEHILLAHEEDADA